MNYFRKLWYRLKYGIEFGLDKTLLPDYGEGSFVSVFRKGDLIDIVAHKRMNNVSTGTIRLVPCRYNHGMMVEYWGDNGELHWRTHLDYDALYRHGSMGQEIGSA